MSQSTTKIISLNKLLINSENPRFNPVQNQEEALKVMVNNQKEKLLNLIKDILDNGLNPSDLVIVSPHESNFIVLEGNRRVTALKLINKPDLIKNIDKNIWNRLKKILSSYSNLVIDKISCVVFENESDAYKWIKLKHTGENSGRGTVSWDAESNRRFSQKSSGKKSPGVQVIDFVKNSKAFDDDVKDNVDKISLTNLERLVADPIIRESIGLELKDGLINQNFPDDEIAKPLSKIVTDLANKNIVVGDIYTKDKRIDYLSGFPKNFLPDETKKLEKKEILNEDVSSTNNSQSDNKSLPTKIDTVNQTLTTSKNTQRGKDKNFSHERKYLIPSNFYLKINNSRINDIYKELKKLDVSVFTNSVAVLFRVFLELSLDEYLSNKKTNEINDNDKLNKKLQWCLNSLRGLKLINDHDAKPVNNAVSSPTSIFSINTFNSYVHNKNIYPNDKDLKIAWNNLETFIRLLWENIN